MTRQSRTTTWKNLELRTRGETERQDVQHQWRGDNQDHHSAHETRHLTSECARGLLVSSCSRHLHSLHTTSRGSRLKCARVCLISSMHEVSVSLRLWALHSHPTSSSPYSPSISLSSCCPPTSTRIVVTLCTPPTRRWILRTNPTPAQVMSPKTTTSWRRMSSPSQSPPRNSSPSITMTPRFEEMLHNAHREHVYHLVVQLERPVVARGQEPNTEHAQIRTLLERQREQILAECQAEIKKHEFQANYDRRSLQTFSETVDSQQEELHRAQAEELQWRDQQLLHAQLLQQNCEWREGYDKSLNQWNGTFEEASEFHFRHYCKMKISRGPEHYYGIIRQSTRITKWSKLYERF